jgi:hypothetical protein
VLPFKLWMTLRPVQSSLWPAYARCFYDASLPHLPSFRKAPPRVRTIQITVGTRRITVIPALAAKQLQSYFGSQTPLHVIRWPLYGTGLLAIIGLCFGVRADKRYSDKVRRGVQIDGPVLQTRAQFNRSVKGDYLASVR